MNCRHSDVTIAIPFYNEAPFIEKTIKSALFQAGTIILADNASTDESEKMCREYAAKYEHIKYVRHPRNLGALENFLYCLESASTKYFMWLGGHDWLHDGYVEKLLKCYHLNLDAVLVYAPLERVDERDDYLGEYHFNEISQSSSVTTITRISTLAMNLDDCAIVNQLMKTECLEKSCQNVGAFIGLDHVILARMARYGRFIRCDETRYVRRMFSHRTSTGIERITGSRRNDSGLDDMCKGLLKSLYSAPCANPLLKISMLFKVKRVLARRFGYKHVSPLDIFERILRIFVRQYPDDPMLPGIFPAFRAKHKCSHKNCSHNDQ